MRRLFAFARGAALLACAVLFLSLEIFLIGETLRRGLPGLSLRLLFSAPHALTGTPGLLPQVINTALLTAAAVFFAVPAALLCAVWTLRTRRRRLRMVFLRAAGALAGVPSAVYGLFGYLIFGGLCSLRYSLLSGALTAALLVLPTTIFLMRVALTGAPQGLLTGALALGAPEGRAVFTVLLPSAAKGIGSAVLLAASRVAAESAALVLTSGVGETLPREGLLRHFFRSGATLTVGMYQSILEGENDLAFSAGVVLLLLILTLDFFAKGGARCGKK